MPTIRFAGKSITCDDGVNLRRVLLKHKLPLYNGPAPLIHCRGLGTCGTCAVQINGAVSPMTPIERWRLGFPPHKRERGLRLACQCTIQGDLIVTKYEGLWGQNLEVKHSP